MYFDFYKILRAFTRALQIFQGAALAFLLLVLLALVMLGNMLCR
jgi:hypothetical protein